MESARVPRFPAQYVGTSIYELIPAGIRFMRHANGRQPRRLQLRCRSDLVIRHLAIRRQPTVRAR
jgi:hypothetical protein